MKIALGVRVHSGWAAVVAVAGPLNAPTVVDRRHLEIGDPGLPRQPYHAAEELAVGDAEALLARCAERADQIAGQGFRRLLEDLRRSDLQPVVCGILMASGRRLPALPRILAAHSLIHSAEGEFYREVVARAAARHTIAVRRMKEKELLGQPEAA